MHELSQLVTWMGDNKHSRKFLNSFPPHWRQVGRFSQRIRFSWHDWCCFFYCADHNCSFLPQVHTVTAEGLQPKLDVKIYGRIATMQLFRPPNEKQDFLFLLTERYRVAILAYKQVSEASSYYVSSIFSIPLPRKNCEKSWLFTCIGIHLYRLTNSVVGSYSSNSLSFLKSLNFFGNIWKYWTGSNALTIRTIGSHLTPERALTC